MAITFSEIRVGFHGQGAGVGELTWGQMGILRATQRNRRNMNLIWPMPLPEGTPLAEIVAMLRFLVSRHPALRTRLRFVDGPSGEQASAAACGRIGRRALAHRRHRRRR